MTASIPLRIVFCSALLFLARTNDILSKTPCCVNSFLWFFQNFFATFLPLFFAAFSALFQHLPGRGFPEVFVEEFPCKSLKIPEKNCKSLKRTEESGNIFYRIIHFTCCVILKIRRDKTRRINVITEMSSLKSHHHNFFLIRRDRCGVFPHGPVSPREGPDQGVRSGRMPQSGDKWACAGQAF